jgi:hypothetical protein
MENQDSKVKFCFSFEYILLLFIDKAFAFITFTDDTCVDHCMTKRKQFNDEYGITIKRLLPDSITKCERLMSSTDIVIRLDSPGWNQSLQVWYTSGEERLLDPRILLGPAWS